MQETHYSPTNITMCLYSEVNPTAFNEMYCQDQDDLRVGMHRTMLLIEQNYCFKGKVEARRWCIGGVLTWPLPSPSTVRGRRASGHITAERLLQGKAKRLQRNQTQPQKGNTLTCIVTATLKIRP